MSESFSLDLDHFSCTRSGCKLKQLLILWCNIGSEIGGGKIFERKLLEMYLERQEGRVCKTIYRLSLMKVMKCIMKWDKIDCTVLESLTDEVHEYVQYEENLEKGAKLAIKYIIIIIE